ncbi:hypothetical protein EVAR_67904_1 [Eumeta japonica]|uniref:Uncharacterized protein n=1 Tax=Eumeta variegata TaxID=151549 RepID=A0A4C1YX43_EUMVA|nr:hypothetical protein EVAR_67904_1 [Eumeta japonica]
MAPPRSIRIVKIKRILQFTSLLNYAKSPNHVRNFRHTATDPFDGIALYSRSPDVYTSRKPDHALRSTQLPLLTKLKLRQRARPGAAACLSVRRHVSWPRVARCHGMRLSMNHRR